MSEKFASIYWAFLPNDRYLWFNVTPKWKYCSRMINLLQELILQEIAMKKLINVDLQKVKEQIEKKVKAGYGQGVGSKYIPWLKVHQVPSRGRSSRIAGWKTRRDHHCLSDLETMYLFMLEWAPDITDVREQFPLLPIEETIQIAEELEIDHPREPSTG